jgi:hypothetical protein
MRLVDGGSPRMAAPVSLPSPTLTSADPPTTSPAGRKDVNGPGGLFIPKLRRSVDPGLRESGGERLTYANVSDRVAVSPGCLSRLAPMMAAVPANSGKWCFEVCPSGARHWLGPVAETHLLPGLMNARCDIESRVSWPISRCPAAMARYDCATRPNEHESGCATECRRELITGVGRG